MRSEKENTLDNLLLSKVKALNLSGKAEKTMKLLLSDEEMQIGQEYANTVSIVRLGYNDHGPVHMRTVTLNAIRMLRLLRQARVKTSLETDGAGDFEDSLIAVILAAMLHDLGMCVGRQDHDFISAILAMPIINRVLKKVYSDNIQKQVIIRSLAIEGIIGHMGTRTIHSLEAGIVQIADGCDMTKGRARIPITIGLTRKTGHIHQYSANSIEEVQINSGFEKPIRIIVLMSDVAGFFQVEEVLLKKIDAGTAKEFIELFAKVKDKEEKQYL